MTSLVTGLGYIGVPLARALLERGDRVVGLENGFSTDWHAIRPLMRCSGFHLVRGSANSPTSIRRAVQTVDSVDRVFHLAAQASAHPAAAAASYTELTNLVAPRLVFEAAARHGVKRFVYGSSFRVYGDTLAGTVAEDRPYGRLSDLSHLSKVYAEKLIEMLAHASGLTSAVVRLGVVYGLGPVMKLDPRFLTVPNLFCLRAARGERLVVHPGANRPIGFLHLDDAVAALLAAAEAPEEPRWQPFNAVSEVLTVADVASIVAAEAARRGLSVQIEGTGPPPAYRWTTRSALAAVGYQPRRTMAETLGAVLAYYVDRIQGASASSGMRK